MFSFLQPAHPAPPNAARRFTVITLNNRAVELPKAVVSPEIAAKTVLTNEPWDFVDLTLANQNKLDARFYWQQAREFFDVAGGLRLESAPLLLYYSYLNAVKALLTSHGVVLDERHGVSKEKFPVGANLRDLTVRIKIQNLGILPALSLFYGETEPLRSHSLSDVFFNVPYIHRTFCLTNDPMEEMYIPIIEPRFVVEDGTQNAFLMARLSSNFPNPRYCTQLPPSFSVLGGTLSGHVISVQSTNVSSIDSPTAQDVQRIRDLGKSLREDVSYINGFETLWYLKAVPINRTRIRRQPTTLTLAAMHRLSEECRYHPKNLMSCLEGPNNWLVSEFIKMSGIQFIDEIASEITGKVLLRPNVRSAK